MDDVKYTDNTIPKDRILSTNKILREFIDYANLPETYLTTQNQLLERIIIAALKGVENRINYDLLYRRVRLEYNKLSKENQLPIKTIGVKNTPNESFEFTRVQGSADINPPQLGEEVVAPSNEEELFSTVLEARDTPNRYVAGSFLLVNDSATGFTYIPKSDVVGIQAPYKIELYRTLSHGDDAPAKPTAGPYDADSDTLSNIDSGWTRTFPDLADEATYDYWLSRAIYNPKTKILGSWEAPHKIHGGVDVNLSEVNAEIKKVSDRLDDYEETGNTGAVRTKQTTILHDPNFIAGNTAISLQSVINILKGPDSAAKTLYTTRQAGSFVSEDNFIAPTTENLVVDDETHEALVVFRSQVIS